MSVFNEPAAWEDENGVSSAKGPTQQILRVITKKGSVVSIVVEGTAFHLHATDSTIVIGDPVTILSSTVPALTTRKITNIIISTRAAGKISVKIDGTVIASGRSSPANMNVEINFKPSKSALTGEEITVEFTMLYGKIGQDIDVNLMANDI